jgi:hypothetical protein
MTSIWAIFLVTNLLFQANIELPAFLTRSEEKKRQSEMSSSNRDGIVMIFSILAFFAFLFFVYLMLKGIYLTYYPIPRQKQPLTPS